MSNFDLSSQDNQEKQVDELTNTEFDREPIPREWMEGRSASGHTRLVASMDVGTTSPLSHYQLLAEMSGEHQYIVESPSTDSPLEESPLSAYQSLEEHVSSAEIYRIMNRECLRTASDEQPIVGYTGVAASSTEVPEEDESVYKSLSGPQFWGGSAWLADDDNPSRLSGEPSASSSSDGDLTNQNTMISGEEYTLFNLLTAFRQMREDAMERRRHRLITRLPDVTKNVGESNDTPRETEPAKFTDDDKSTEWHMSTPQQDEMLEHSSDIGSREETSSPLTKGMMVGSEDEDFIRVEEEPLASDVCQWQQPWNHQGLSIFELILDSEELPSELRSEDPYLIQFLQEANNIIKLAQLVVCEGPSGDESVPFEELRTVKLPMIAQEILSSNPGVIAHSLLEIPEAVNTLLLPLQQKPPLDERLVARLANVLGFMFNKFPDDIARTLSVWRAPSECPPPYVSPRSSQEEETTMIGTGAGVSSMCDTVGSSPFHQDDDENPPSEASDMKTFDSQTGVAETAFDPLIDSLLQHAHSDGIVELLRCAICVSHSLVLSRPLVLYRLVQEIGRTYPWDTDELLILERSENIVAVITHILGTASNVPDFETLFLNLISKPSADHILRLLNCDAPEIIRICCELMSVILSKCDEIVAAAESRKVLPVPCLSPSVSTPLMKPHSGSLGLLEASPPSNVEENSPLDVVDTGLFLRSPDFVPPPNGAEPLISPTLSIEVVEYSQTTELRLSSNGVKLVRSFLAQSAQDHLQQAICRSLCPQVIAVRLYQRGRHRKDYAFAGRDHCRARPVQKDDGPKQTEDTPPNGLACETTFNWPVSAEGSGTAEGQVHKMCDASESTTSGSSPPGTTETSAGRVETESLPPAEDSQNTHLADLDEELLTSDENRRQDDSSGHTAQHESRPHSTSTNPMNVPQVPPEEDRSDAASGAEDTNTTDLIMKVELPQGNRPRVGALCLSLINLIYAVIRIRSPESEAFACRFVPVLVDLFFSYKWNSLLHNAIKQVLLCVIEQTTCHPGCVLEVLLTETCLASQLVKLAKRQKRIRLEPDITIRRQRRARHKVGYVPQAFQIAESLILKCSQSPLLQDLLSSVQGWTKTVVSEVQYYVSLMSEQLGGSRCMYGYGPRAAIMGTQMMVSDQGDNVFDNSGSSASSVSSTEDEADTPLGRQMDDESGGANRTLTSTARHDVLMGVRATY
eukprot:Blabericola_migrator_1__5950@NODE_2_length_32877_cov_165_790003_g1_i0_p1_GENE_NODE_2_length_32877_cov_165_790003_g1_i0NODE_2_length_32877_cov_165_790003_g1_i0_p1_ORF_typecomplete_len1200_score211_80SAPS/PF04499_15/1_5e10Hyccin/PF09790_9/0_07_NODE_2_length_32877_cov_165_790003_g1_i01976923368